MSKSWQKFILSLALGSCCFTANAQWTTQTIVLRAGWNAVFLGVQPAPSDCDTLFAGVPIASVWSWNSRFSSVQYISDPNSLLPGQPDWLTYLPPSDPDRAVANLFRLHGGRPYLIKASAAATLTIRGQPVIRALDWVGESFNLAGFYVASTSPPTFQSFFAPSPAHAGQPIYRLNAAGSWLLINPSSTIVNQGECYWVRSAGPSSYSGLSKITFEQGRALDYGRTLVEQTLRIRNTSTTTTTTYSLRKLASGSPPNPDYPALAGDVPLSYYRMNLSNNQVGWVPLPAQLVSDPIPPGGEWTLRLEVRRADMASFSPPLGYADVRYQALLEVTDTLGSRLTIPVSANGLQNYAAASNPLSGSGRPSGGGGAAVADPRTGLWIGSVVLDKVNQAAQGDLPSPTASQFQFRLILHVDTSGETRLLQKVLLAWTNGVYITNQQGYREAVSPGRSALVTDEKLLSRFSGSALRDGIVTGHRFSSAAFAFKQPILVSRSGDFGEANSLFSCTVPLGSNDELNPFKHKYHPDHNNLDDRFEEVKQESPDVTRQLSFRFTGTDPDNTTLAGWGDNQLGGTYEELIMGLHKYPIHAQGTFRLYRASTVGVLNDGSF